MGAASCLAAGDRAARRPSQGRSIASGFATGPVQRQIVMAVRRCVLRQWTPVPQEVSTM